MQYNIRKVPSTFRMFLKSKPVAVLQPSSFQEDNAQANPVNHLITKIMVQTILTLRQMQTSQATTDTYYSVYPNPASDKIVVLRKQFTEGANQVVVSNTIGEVVYNAYCEASPGMHLINSSTWQKGIYCIQITNDIQAVFNFKVVIIK